MNRKLQFTATFVAAASAGTWTDTMARGLKLRVGGMTKTYFHQFQVRGIGARGARGRATRGTMRKMHIGHADVMSLDEARRLVTYQRDTFVLHGIDPQGVDKARTATPAALVVGPDAVLQQAALRAPTDGGMTFAEALTAAYAPDGYPATTRNDLNAYILPSWRDRSILSIGAEDVDDLMAPVNDKNPVKSRPGRVFNTIKRVFKWAAENGKLRGQTNPTVGLKYKIKAGQNTHVVKLDDLRKLFAASGDHGHGPAFKMLALLGQRRGETSRMKWADLDLDADVPTWVIPWQDRKTGKENKLDHVVFLPSQAVDVLRGVFADRKANEAKKGPMGVYVFTVNGGHTFAHCWRLFVPKLKSKTPQVEDWIIHDLRRTVLTAMAELDVAPHIISRVASHTMGAGTNRVTDGYIQAEFAPEKRDAWQRWADLLMEDVS